MIAGISGRVALPAAYAGARRARVPFVLWATIWGHPRTAAHAASYLPLRHIYRDADAIATYGPHVSAYVRRKGARGPVFEAPQAVDSRLLGGARRSAPDVRVLTKPCLSAESRGERPRSAHLGLARLGPSSSCERAGSGRRGAVPSPAPRHQRGTGRRRGHPRRGAQPPDEVRNFYAGSDVVVLPSVRTREFLEPWGLVVNEAFHQGRPVIATHAVGAVAGGLLRHQRNGLVVAPGDPAALAAALRRLHDDPALRDRLGAQARADVAAYTFDAWADGMADALAAAGSSSSRSRKDALT